MRKVRIEFKDEDGKPVLETFRLWLDGEEIIDGVRKGIMIKIFAREFPWEINPLGDALDYLFNPSIRDFAKRLMELSKEVS